ncbi:MAG: CoA transferase [Candidatus Binataceae bacterium]|jgi:crotonobetainyl-CoA:carnitine CoA-transferase CaiB-like acyl-CoA transferase
MATLPLEGIRVLDFTWVVAGPVATRILADFGAEVIKLERKPGPPGSRQTGLQGDLHRNKLSIAVNMASPRGIALARRLALISDLVIDNFSARVMRSWGMDFATLSHLKPEIVCVSMSGLGHTGPHSNYVSYGPTLQALSGYTLLMTEGGGEPAGFGYSYADMSGGYTGAFAALIALWHRRRTGQGQFVDLSQFEAVASVIGPALLDIAVNGRAQTPFGYQSQERPAAPHGVYRCRPRDGDNDRWLALSVRTQDEWERFVEVIGSPPWTSGARFQTLYLRMRNGSGLDAKISEWAANQVAEEAMALLQRAGIAAGVVANGADLCQRDPHLQARNFWGAVTLPDGASTHTTGVASRLSATPGSVRTPSPMIGSSNDYVLGELLGLSRAERDGLIEARAIWV